ncbi:uncharacterized protein HKW66_Vig0127250 [Vigna angularis]|uniref:Uncharacterized protein n=1 Tax=Phaseolus angularis TaxID=3914 RepID=A0A8T0K316_PHAAN|nr:uncharacterized protein HKW66_Vig0127250 [Vigna angularis]
MVEGGGCILDGMQSGPCSEQVVKKVEVREGPVNVVQHLRASIVNLVGGGTGPLCCRGGSKEHGGWWVLKRVRPRVSVDLNQNIEYIPEQPEWTGYRDLTPPSPPSSVDEYSPGQTQSVPSVPSGGTSSSRGSKRKAPMVDVIDSQFDKLTTSLDGFANVLSSSNVHFGVISDVAVR